MSLRSLLAMMQSEAQIDPDFESIEPPEPIREPKPCPARPGSSERIETLRRRVERGQRLWASGDVVVDWTDKEPH